MKDILDKIVEKINTHILYSSCPIHAMTAEWEQKYSSTTLALDGSKWSVACSSYPRKLTLMPIEVEAEWAHGPVCTFMEMKKYRPTRISTLIHPAPSQGTTLTMLPQA